MVESNSKSLKKKKANEIQCSNALAIAILLTLAK